MAEPKYQPTLNGDPLRNVSVMSHIYSTLGRNFAKTGVMEVYSNGDSKESQLIVNAKKDKADKVARLHINFIIGF
jgi:hypothetical protein